MAYRQFGILTVLIVAAVVTVGCSTVENQKSRTVETLWLNGSVKKRYEVATFVDADGTDVTDDTALVKHGNFLSWYESGNVNQEGSFVRGKREGDWTYRHDTKDNGLLMSGAYLDNAMHGEWRWWMPAGHNHDHTAMKMSPPDDTQSNSSNDFLPPHKIANYDYGLLHGLSISWHPSGAVADSFTYNYGVLDGVYVSYHQNGVRAAEATYKDGLLVDSMQIWDSLGSPVR